MYNHVKPRTTKKQNKVNVCFFKLIRPMLALASCKGTFIHLTWGGNQCQAISLCEVYIYVCGAYVMVITY